MSRHVTRHIWKYIRVKNLILQITAEHRDELQKEGGIRGLVDLLQSKNENVARNAAFALGNACVNNGMVVVLTQKYTTTTHHTNHIHHLSLHLHSYEINTFRDKQTRSRVSRSSTSISRNDETEVKKNRTSKTLGIYCIAKYMQK